MAWVERPERRTRTSKTFHDPATGRFRFEGGIADLHYRDSNGQWQDVVEDFGPSATPGFAKRADKLRHALDVANDGSRRWYPRRERPDQYVALGAPELWTRVSNQWAWRAPGVILPGVQGGRMTWDRPTHRLDLDALWRAAKVTVTVKVPSSNSVATDRVRWPYTLVGLALDTATGVLTASDDGTEVGRLEPPTAEDANKTPLPITQAIDGDYVTYQADLSSAVYPVVVDPTFSVGADADDGNWQSPFDALVLNDGFGTIQVGWNTATSKHLFLRFTSVGIPSGATITAASLGLANRWGGGSSTTPATVRANDTGANPAAPTTASAAKTPARTSASVAWSLSDAGAQYTRATSPDLASVVQELVTTYGALSSILLYVEDLGAQSGATRLTQWADSSAGSTYAPQLTITYTTGDTTAPTFASASVPSAGTSVAVVLTETDSPPILPASGVTGFSLVVNGSARSITSATASGTTVTLVPASTIYAGDTVTVAYTPGNVTDSATSPNALAAFGAQSVTNGSTATAPVTLQSLIDAATAGTTLSIPAGTYREEVTIAKALTLEGGADTILCGSDVWTGWSASGSYWLSSLTVPALAWTDNTAVDLVNHPEAGWPEQVFVDGAEQTQLAAGSTPGAGQFCLVSSGDRHIRLGTDPTGKTVEVTTRAEVIKVNAATVTIRGRSNSDRIEIKHGGSDYQHGLICARHGSAANNLTVKWANVSYGHNTGIQTMFAGDLTLQFVRSHHHGMNGGNIQGTWTGFTKAWGLLIEDCLFDFNNTQYGNGGWHAAGLKISVFGGRAANPATIRRTVFANNLACAGLWCDTHTPGLLIGSTTSLSDGNWSYRNGYQGIRCEITDGQEDSSDLLTIANNRTYQNGDAGLWLDVVKDALVKQNICVYDKRDNLAYTQTIDVHWNSGRGDYAVVGSTGPTNVVLDGNVVINTQGTYRRLVAWRTDGTGTMGDASNYGQNGQYAVTDDSGNVTNESGGYKPFAVAYGDKSLAEFNASQYEEGATYFADTAAKNVYLTARSLPLTPTGDPATPSGIPIAVFAATYARRRAA